MTTKTPAEAQPPRDTVLVDLGLQGGGAHGAFTWGVLDRALEEPRLQLRGHLRHLGRRDERRRDGGRLHGGWRRRGARGPRAVLAAGVRRGPLQPVPARTPRHPHGQLDAGLLAISTSRWTSRRDLFSPYDLGMAALNPLARRSSWRTSTSSACARRRSAVYVTATNVRTGRGRVFRNADSRPRRCWRRPACRRCSRRSRSTATRTGTAASRATRRSSPLVRECSASDTMLVQINPVERPGTPRSARDIHEPPERDLVQLAAAEGAAS
jgi:NTE family protein